MRKAERIIAMFCLLAVAGCSDGIEILAQSGGTSQYEPNPRYSAQVTKVESIDDGIELHFNATGPLDLRHPSGSCLKDSKGTRLRPTGLDLTSNQPGNYVGRLRFSVQPGEWRFTYSCIGGYSYFPIVKVEGDRET